SPDTGKVMTAEDKIKQHRSGLSGVFSRIVEAHVLFPVLALVLTAGIWSVTENIISNELNAADKAAHDLVSELSNTYEAQMVRALREINLYFEIVQYAFDQGDGTEVLSDLEARNLLPPSFLFSVVLIDEGGEVVAGTGSLGTPVSVTRDDFAGSTRTETH